MHSLLLRGSLEKKKKDKSDFKNYVIDIGKNIWKDRLKDDIYAKSAIDSLIEEIELSYEIDIKQNKELIYDAINRLNKKERKLLEAQYFEGKSINLIAKELGIAPNIVKSKSYKARKKLGTLLKDMISKEKVLEPDELVQEPYTEINEKVLPKEIATKRTNHLLIIAIDEYLDGEITKLNNAVREAKTFKNLLLEKYQFESRNVTTLFNEEATLRNIRKTFSKILNKLTESDNLVFYYSGHGEQKPYGKVKRGYWIPYDASLNKDYTYIPNEEINLLFKNSRAHHVFGIVDSGYSGSLFQRKLGNPNERISSFPSRWLLTSGKQEVVSDGSQGINSPFSTALFSYLKNYPNDTLWVSDLCNEVLKGMDYSSENQIPRGEPLQDSAHYGGQFVFYKKGFIPQPEVTNIPSKVSSKDSSKGIKSSTLKTPTSLKELKTYLKELVAQDLEKGLIQFKKYITPNSPIESDITHQQGSFNRNKNQQLKGLITEQNAALTEARIRYALLSYIDDLEMEDLDFY